MKAPPEGAALLFLGHCAISAAEQLHTSQCHRRGHYESPSLTCASLIVTTGSGKVPSGRSDEGTHSIHFGRAPSVFMNSMIACNAGSKGMNKPMGRWSPCLVLTHLRNIFMFPLE